MKRGILELGVSPDQPGYVQDKIRLSNQVAIIIAFVGISYTIFSLIFYPSLAIYPIGAIVFALLTYLLNFLGLTHLSRFILSALVLLLAYLYHANLVQLNEPFITSLYLIQFALTIIPWILFDFREATLLIASLAFCYLLMFSQEWANAFIKTELDSAIYREGFLNIASYVFAVVILISCLLFMQMKNFNTEKEVGNLLENVKVKNDELETQKRELHQTIEEVNMAKEEESKRGWINEGLAKLDGVLRSNQGSDNLTKLITFIVKYANTNQGGIYLAEEINDENFLTLKGCYAYDREKFINDRFDIEEGLIGQAYKEKAPILLNEVPQDYIKITSGLGEATPNCVFIIPLVDDNKVSGIIELASFNRIEEHVRQFIESTAEHVASYIESFKYSVETQKLLETTQSQAEEMRSQEEEMKQTLEEMHAIHEEMNRKEKEYIEKIAYLEDVIAQDKSKKVKTYQ